MKTAINTTIEGSLKELALYNEIAFNDALDFGVKFLLAEKDRSFDYPESKLQNRLIAINNRLTEQLENKEVEEDNKIEETFTAKPDETPEFVTADKLVDEVKG